MYRLILIIKILVMNFSYLNSLKIITYELLTIESN